MMEYCDGDVVKMMCNQGGLGFMELKRDASE